MKKTTDITVVLDRSGSMYSIKESTIEGFNTFLKNQKSNKLKTNISFIQFDDQYEMVYEEKDIKSVKYLNFGTYIPRGTTALLDAIGITINNLEERIENKSKRDRPEKVVVVIITDGYENASTKYNRKKILRKITRREIKNNWKFVFLGANQDAIIEGGKMGFNHNSSLTFEDDNDGVKDAFLSLSNNLIKYQKSKLFRLSFSDEDREKQKRY